MANYTDFKVDYHVQKRVKLTGDQYQASAGDTILIRADNTIKGATGTDQHKLGVKITLPASPLDGDEVVIRDIGNQTDKTNEVVVISSDRNIDARDVNLSTSNPSTKWPDKRESSGYWENMKSALLKSRGGRFSEIKFQYDGTNQRWDSSIAKESDEQTHLSAGYVHNNARLRAPTTLLETEFPGLTISLVDEMPGWWIDPKTQVDGQVGSISGVESKAWCVPTSCANWLGYYKAKKAGVFSTVLDWPLSATLGTATWHGHQYHNDVDSNNAATSPTRPAITETYAQNISSGTLTDFGWYMNTNDNGSHDAAIYNYGNSHIGTKIPDIYTGFTQFLTKAQFDATSITNSVGLAYNTLTFNSTPVWTGGNTAGNGNVSRGYLTSGETDNSSVSHADVWSKIRNQLVLKNPFIACFKHWDLKRRIYDKDKLTVTLAPLAPETAASGLLTDFPISFYEWGPGNYPSSGNGDSAPNGEPSVPSDSSTPFDAVGHTVLVVGFIETTGAVSSFIGTNSNKYFNLGDGTPTAQLPVGHPSAGTAGTYDNVVFQNSADASNITTYLLILDDWKTLGDYYTNEGTSAGVFDRTEYGVNGRHYLHAGVYPTPAGATTTYAPGGAYTGLRHIKAIPIAYNGGWYSSVMGGLDLLIAAMFVDWNTLVPA